MLYNRPSFSFSCSTNTMADHALLSSQGQAQPCFRAKMCLHWCRIVYLQSLCSRLEGKWNPFQSVPGSANRAAQNGTPMLQFYNDFLATKFKRLIAFAIINTNTRDIEIRH